MKYLFSLIFLFCSLFYSIAASLPEAEKELSALFEALKGSQTKDESLLIHAQIEATLYEALQNPKSFQYPFETLHFLGKIYSDDNLLRIYTWNVPFADGTFMYGCIIQQKKNNTLTVLKIKDVAYKPNLDRYIAVNNWYGALYYRAIPVSHKKDTYYTLLGWSGNDSMTNFKTIDALTFNDKGKAQLGLPVFKRKNKTQHRYLLEYGGRDSMSLDYDKKKKQIIFDHLAPSSDKYKGIHTDYGPDFSYDAFQLKKKDWIFVEEVDARNKD